MSHPDLSKILEIAQPPVAPSVPAVDLEEPLVAIVVARGQAPAASPVYPLRFASRKWRREPRSWMPWIAVTSGKWKGTRRVLLTGGGQRAYSSAPRMQMDYKTALQLALEWKLDKREMPGGIAFVHPNADGDSSRHPRAVIFFALPPRGPADEVEQLHLLIPSDLEEGQQ